MKRNSMYFAMLFCLCSLAGAASCSESNPNDDGGDPGKLQSLVIEPETLALTVGQTTQLTAKGTPESASLENLRWSSRDTKIAKVEDDGQVTGVAVGSTTIVASCDGKTAEREVTVSAASVVLKEIKLSPSAYSMEKGKTFDIQATLVPADAEVEGNIVWDSSNKTVATIDQNGRVTSIADGRTAITATLEGITATCHVEVYGNKSERTFTFFQLNLWEGLVNITNGTQALIDHLVELEPDAASFCEFPSTGSAQSILKEAADALLEKTGIPYYYTYLGGSGTRGLLTRHPIVSSDGVNNNSWFYRTVIDFYGQEMALYASHAFHSYYACYLPRGYGDGETPYGWEQLDGGTPVTDIDFILEREELSGRTQIATDLIADTKAQKTLGRLCIFGGDLNQPSHLDWTEATKNTYEHNGCVVPWPISTALYADGIRDAYREVYTDPFANPGITWPVSNKDSGKPTQWAPLSDDRDRIDYIYFRPETNFSVTDVKVVGPKNSIEFSQIVAEKYSDGELIEPVNDRWPSDHRGLLGTFNVGFSN